MNLKVGKILQCQRHENADKLYVSQIQIEDNLGEESNNTATSTIQVCSGLVNFIPIEQMVGRKVVVLANIKASKQRGVKSEAMLLAAEKSVGSDSEGDVQVELINPPAHAGIGHKLYFHPYVSDEYPSKLKSKAWEDIQKHLRTTATGEAAYVRDGGEECLLKTKDGNSESANAASLTDAIIR